ncbi:MAG: hypothetical protein IPG96_10125 [Proteobacteria bacterium]|nr:hypothetical protein [Pseudomonadota bacterium]
MVEELRTGEKPVPCFHWDVEFPEVFNGDQSGFDALVGNPPFAGKNTTAHWHRPAFLPWLQTVHEESHGNADLVAHFFRRAFTRLRSGGTLGLVATNTIRQGDTRSTGLRWICKHGGNIYAARKRIRWPGRAAVVVSVVHVARERRPACMLDGCSVERITAFLFPRGGHDDPTCLLSNQDQSFKGAVVLGLGFVFENDNPPATPLAELERLRLANPRNGEMIFPYLGGESVNDSPTHTARRFVISFGTLELSEARMWPDLLAIVEAKVRPERERASDNADGRRRKKYWWQWGRDTPALYERTKHMNRLLVASQTSKYRSFTFAANDQVFDQKLIVFAFDDYATFATLQSRLHEAWALFFGSTMKDDPVYTPSDCFETFPFPIRYETRPDIESSGKAYYEFRAALMLRNNEGLTKTYNCFHDPVETNADIIKLRDLHAAMDRAVLDAYRMERHPADLRVPPRLRGGRRRRVLRWTPQRRSRGATAGQTMCAMRSSPVSSS